MLIAWNNLGDAGTVTADSTFTGFPASNVQNAHLTIQHRTAAAVKTVNLIFDLGSSKTCGCVAVLGGNYTASATIQVRSSDADPTVAASLELNTGSLSAGSTANYPQIYKTFTPTNSRYWRLTIADSSVASNVWTGRVFLGPYWTPTYGQSYDWSITSVDPSRWAKSIGGQTHLDVRNKARVLQFSLDWNNEAQMFDNAFELARANGRVKDVLVIPNTAGSYIQQQAIWGLVQASEPIVHANVNIFRQKFSVEERL